MKTSRIIFFAVLAAAVGGILIVRRQMALTPEQPTSFAAKSSAVQNQASRAVKSFPAPVSRETEPTETVSKSSRTQSVAQVEEPVTQTNARPQTIQSQANQSLTYNGYTVQDPMARVALYFVGTGDSEANTYWESAIFDANLPAEERKDLIEDLNETGMADPHHPGPADMPLILARIQLIEQLAPYSIDQVDADAFGEAYKDLVGMANGQVPK